jgi:hypothetical protein
MHILNNRHTYEETEKSSDENRSSQKKRHTHEYCIKEQYHTYSYSKSGQIIDERKINEYNEVYEIGILMNTCRGIHNIRMTEQN